MPSSPEYLPIARPRSGPEEIEAVAEVLRSGWLTQGPWVKRFETAFAERHNFKPGERITLMPRLDCVHLFDAQTGVNLRASS